MKTANNPKWGPHGVVKIGVKWRNIDLIGMLIKPKSIGLADAVLSVVGVLGYIMSAWNLSAQPASRNS